MYDYKTIVSLCPEGTDTVFALAAGDRLGACVEQRRPVNPLYALLPKVKPDISPEELLALRPDVVLVPWEYDCADRGELSTAGVEVLSVGGNTLQDAYNNIREIGRCLGRGTEAEKVVTKSRYGFSRLEEKLARAVEIRTAFFTGAEPYAAVGGDSLLQELLAMNKLVNIYADVKKECLFPDLSTLRLLDVQLVLLPDYPEEFSDAHAMELGTHTEHALTVFVPGELFRGGASLARLADFYGQLNEKIRRFSSDSLADRDKPTYF